MTFDTNRQDLIYLKVTNDNFVGFRKYYFLIFLLVPILISISTSDLFAQSEPRNVIFQNQRMVDGSGNVMTSASVGQQVFFTAFVENQQSTELPFNFVIIVKNNQGIVEHEAWLSGILNPGQSFEPTLAWEISSPVNYVISLELWNNPDDRDLLADSFILPISVEGATEPSDDTIPLKDTLPPEVLIPSDIRRSVNNPDSSIVTFYVSAIDNVDQIIPSSCSPSSGSPFPFGETTVVCTATDSSGNIDTRSFTVTLEYEEFDRVVWVRNNVGEWANDQISEREFLSYIEFMIKNSRSLI